MKAFARIFTIIILSCISLHALSQSKSEPMIWLHASEKIHFSPKVSGLFLYQKRLFLERTNTYQDLYWVSGAYRLKRLQVGGGTMYFSAHKFLTSTYKSIPEIRPFQYASVAGRIHKSRWNYQIRLMFEQRILSTVTEDQFRIGEKFQMRYRLRKNAVFHLTPNASLKLSNELLWADEMELVQNRAFGEVAYVFKTLRLSAGYMNWYVKGIKKPVRHVWLFRVDHQLKFR